MANIPGEIVWQANDNTWFTTNAAEVYPAGITIYHVDGRYKFTDGVTALSALSFLGGGSGVQSVTGANVDNTDTLNPVVNIPTLQEVTDEGYDTTNLITINSNNVALERIKLTGVLTHQAVAGQSYIKDGSVVTFNDPVTPVSGDSYDVINASGVSIIGGLTYGVTTRIVRFYNGSIWRTYITNNDNTGDETASTIGAIVNGAASATPNDTDLVMSVESSVAKKNTWTQIKAFLKTYFDTIYLKLTGGFLTGLLGLAKSTNIASATTTDLSTATGNLVHITGNTTIASFGTLPAGIEINLVFDGTPIITNSANIICPGNVSLAAGVNDTATVVSEGGGVWRFLSFYKYDESYTNYTPSFTGFSVTPTITAGDCRWKMLTKNTCHVIIWITSAGTSNATTMTTTLPFTAAWSGGAGFGLQQLPMGMLNNGVHVNGCVRTRISGSNILDCYNGAVGAAFTASGTKAVFLNFVFQIEI